MTLLPPRTAAVLLCVLASAITGWICAGVAVAAGPTNTAPPSISGTAQQGQTLTLNPGTWTDAAPPAPSIADVWQSCTGSTCSAISPQPAGLTYTLAPGDVGKTITVAETATASDGTATVNSPPTATVTALAPVNSVRPTIGGTAQVGNVLTVTQGQWSGSPTITDQWQDCDTSGLGCKPTSAPTGTSYTVAQSDVGFTIAVLETATNSGGTATASSAPTVQIVAPPTELSAPSISGTPHQGSPLTESHGTWTGSPTSYSYQWKRCSGFGCTAIPGATSQSYTPTADDLGATIAVTETASNAGGPSAPADSALTAVITTPAGVVPPPASISAPTLSGTPEQGQTLLEAHGSWSGNPSSYSYQWESCASSGCTPIPGATGQSYALTAADVEQTIVVVETASNSGGSSGPATSGHSAAVSATSATSLAVSPSGPMTNQTVTLVATVISSSGNANPGGWVTFFDGSRAISRCTNERIKSTGQSVTIICQAAFPAGTAALTAMYTPSAGLLVGASISTMTALDVGRDSTSTSLAVSKQVVRGKRATYTATVVLPASNSGPIEPAGSIEFLDGGRPIRGCLNRPLTRLTATCAVKYGSFSKHAISARYTGDSNFRPSGSSTRSVQIVKDASAPLVFGFISSTLQWEFNYHPTYTQVALLGAEGIVRGITVLLTCHGAGCPFTSLSVPTGTSASIDLLPVFHKRHLRVGSQITLRIMRPHWIGKYYSFTVRPGLGPLIVLSCLGVGRWRPGVGC